MIRASHQYHSLFRAAAHRLGIAMAATLALALGIGVNAAIFNIGGPPHAAGIDPAQAGLFLQPAPRFQTVDAAILTGAGCEGWRGRSRDVGESSLPCVLAHLRDSNLAVESKCPALLFGDYLITLNLYAGRAGARQSIAPGVR